MIHLVRVVVDHVAAWSLSTGQGSDLLTTRRPLPVASSPGCSSNLGPVPKTLVTGHRSVSGHRSRYGTTRTMFVPGQRGPRASPYAVPFAGHGHGGLCCTRGPGRRAPIPELAARTRCLRFPAGHRHGIERGTRAVVLPIKETRRCRELYDSPALIDSQS